VSRCFRQGESPLHPVFVILIIHDSAKGTVGAYSHSMVAGGLEEIS
jgi:hypothetical protein